MDHKHKTYRKAELITAVLSLMEFCPVEDCNPDDCPLYNVRKLKHPQRNKWLSALGEDDLAYLLAYHDVCLNLKMGITRPHPNSLHSAQDGPRAG
jgi:hypothetical protein